jgi:predicted nucleic acid-binding protein
VTLPLTTFVGAALYVDAMIAVGLLDAHSSWHAAAERLFGQAIDPARPIRLVTATPTVDEVAFVLLQELVARPPIAVTRSRSQYLAEHPEVVRQLTRQIEAPLESLVDLLTLEPVLPEDVLLMRREMAATGLLPRDALHVAVMRRLGLTAIASDDEAFDRCASLIRYAP